MNKIKIGVLSLLCVAPVCLAQTEVSTQALVEVLGNAATVPTAADVQLSVNGKKGQPTGWSKVPPASVQVAILLDDGLKLSVGRELSELKTFVSGLPQGTQLLIGYMHNGNVSIEQRFTTDLASASKNLHFPIASSGISASPYLCVSELVQQWPADPAQPAAKFVLLITDGVDPNSGGNQSSPYVEAAEADAQRAGVVVSAIYYGASSGDGRGGQSGQAYLADLTDSTGGHSFYEGSGNPVSMAPFLAQFQHSIGETFVATFPAKGKGKDLIRIKADTKLNGTKLRVAQAVRAGNVEIAASK